MVAAELAVGTRLGRPRLPRDEVVEVQRSRMLAAAIDAVADSGYERLTVAAVIARARVSRKTFYEVFADREDCFLAAFEHALARARAAVSDAYSRESSWREGIRCALGSLLVLIDEEPDLARLCIVEASGAGHEVSRRRAELLTALAQVIDRGRANTKRHPPEVSAEGAVGAVLAVLHARILMHAEEPMLDLLGPLMYMIVLPYLGPKAAASELDKPTPRTPRQRRVPDSQNRRDPLAGLNMRLTHRTVLVLAAIADNPGANNREVAEAAGVSDQGQISKLLRRLAALELIENHGWGQEKGAPNAWRLTPRGLQIARSARPR